MVERRWRGASDTLSGIQSTTLYDYKDLSLYIRGCNKKFCHIYHSWQGSAFQEELVEQGRRPVLHANVWWTHIPSLQGRHALVPQIPYTVLHVASGSLVEKEQEKET